MLPWAIVH